MTLQLDHPALSPGDHLVHFYADEPDLCGTIGGYIVETLRRGGSAILIAEEAHRLAFEAQLESAGIDVAGARRDGALVALDAAATVASLMRDGTVDTNAFHEIVGAVVREAVEAGGPVCAYGEMVSLLWDAGDVLAAIELEKRWNDLQRDLPFTLLCSYHSDAVSGPEHAEELEQICHLHTSVLGEVSGEFPANRHAPGNARHLVSEALRRWGYGERLIEDVELVLSELATNAVLYARSSFAVVARRHGSGVRISVRDASPVEPTLRKEPPVGPTGRGMRIVAALSKSWGVDVSGAGKTVWVELGA